MGANTQLNFNPLTGSLDLIQRDDVALIAGSTVSPGDALALNALGRAVPASAVYADGLWRVVGVAATAAANGTLVRAVVKPMLVGANFSAAPAGADNGKQVFLASAGEGTLVPTFAAGHVIFCVGILQGADGITQRPAVMLRPQYITRVV